jgi:hypothetical protein
MWSANLHYIVGCHTSRMKKIVQLYSAWASVETVKLEVSDWPTPRASPSNKSWRKPASVR